MFRLFFIFFLIIAIPSSYANVIIKNENETFRDIDTLIYEDVSAMLSFDDILKIKDFNSYTNRISEGYSDSAFWIKFEVQNKTSKNLDYFIKFTEVFQDKIDCYILSSNSDFSKQEAGVGYFVNNQDNTITRPTFKLKIDANESKKIYIRITSKYPNFTSFHLMQKDSLEKFSKKYDLIYTFFFGAIITLMLYNLVIYFYTRQISYIYYVFFGFFFTSWQLMLSGFFPLNNFNSTNSFYLTAIFIPIFLAFLMLFSRAILNTNKLFIKIDNILKYVAIIYFILAIGSIFSVEISLFIMNKITTFILPFLLFVGFKSYFAGNRTAIFFIFAQVSFLAFSTLFSLAAQGYLEYTFVNRYGILLGSLIEMVLFSLALAYQIRLLEKQKLSIISTANKELDLKVKERTKELEISKRKLEELANQDPLTTLYNRRALFNIGEKLLSVAKRDKKYFSIILFDLDNFKSINDTYGHKTGDNVIVEFSNMLKKLRDSDLIARYGGEEFIVLLSNTKEEDTYNIAMKIKDDVESKTIYTQENEPFNFTVSGGLTMYKLDSEDTLDDTILRADKALYLSKNSGRNKISIL